MATKENSVATVPLSVRLTAPLLRALSHIHVWIYRRTGASIGGRIAGNQILLLTTTGRKTAQTRTTPVAYLADGEAIFIVGGAAGASRHPAWWLNLAAHPEAQVQMGRRRLWVRATKASAEEQQRLWARYPAQRALFDSMQQHVHREIPVVALRPLSAPASMPAARDPLKQSAVAKTPRTARVIHRAALGILYTASHLVNPLTLKLAGSRALPVLAVIQHRGRRSGRTYVTPAGARPTSDGFVIPLTFGEEVDWFRNVRAAGGCVIRWKGAIYPVVEPKVVDWATARPAVYPMERVLMPLIGIEQFVQLRHASQSRRSSAVSQP